MHASPPDHSAQNLQRLCASVLLLAAAGCGGGDKSNVPTGAPTAVDNVAQVPPPPPAPAPTPAPVPPAEAPITTPTAAPPTPAPVPSPAAPSPAPVPVPPPPPTPPPATMSLKAQIEDLEKRGVLPKLDRSSSIAGPDTNANGVRDDIEAIINALSLTAEQKKAAMQKAGVLQQTLVVNLNDPAAVQRVGDALMASTKCLGEYFTAPGSRSEMSQRIESMTANTRERVTRYMGFNSASSGSVTRYPDGDTCEK